MWAPALAVVLLAGLAGCGTDDAPVGAGSTSTTAAPAASTTSSPPTSSAPATTDPCTPPPGAPGTWEAPVHCLPGAPPHLPGPGAEIVAIWHRPESECWPTCVYSGVFYDDGTLVWVDAEGAAAIPYDPAPALAVLDGVSRADLVVGPRDDCMREADGLAPLLAVNAPSGWVVADRCTHELDESHPLVALTEQVPVAQRASSPMIGVARVPAPDCDQTDVASCEWIEHEVYESGLVLTYGDRPPIPSEVPIAAHAAPREVDAILELLVAPAEACFPGAVEPGAQDPFFLVLTDASGGRCWIGPEGELVDRFDALVDALPAG